MSKSNVIKLSGFRYADQVLGNGQTAIVRNDY